MKFTVSKKQDMVNAVEVLKQGKIEDYIIENKSGNIFYKINKDAYDNGLPNFYEKDFSGQPIHNPYFVDFNETEQDAEIEQDDQIENENLNDDTQTLEYVKEEHNMESVSEVVEPEQQEVICESQKEPAAEQPYDVSKNENKNNDEEYSLHIQELEKQNDELNSMCESLSQDKASLEQQINELNMTIAEYETKCENLTAENTLLVSDINAKTSENIIKTVPLDDLVNEIVNRGFDIELKRSARSE